MPLLSLFELCKKGRVSRDHIGHCLTSKDASRTTQSIQRREVLYRQGKMGTNQNSTSLPVSNIIFNAHIIIHLVRDYFVIHKAVNYTFLFKHILNNMSPF